MKHSRWPLFSRITIVAILYPWLVSFDAPGDSLPSSFSIYGGAGSYSYVTRDCNNRVTSSTPVGFADYAAAWQTGFSKEFSVRLRGGHISSEHAFNIIVDGDSASMFNPIGIFYGGGSFEINSPVVGLDIGALGFSHRVTLGPEGDYTFTTELRVGYLSAWYWTLALSNDDPLLSGRPLLNTGLGFNISPGFSRDHPNLQPSHLWLGFGLGPPYDNQESLGIAELTIPASIQWMFTLRASYDFSQFSQGAMSGGITYRF